MIMERQAGVLVEEYQLVARNLVGDGHGVAHHVSIVVFPTALRSIVLEHLERYFTLLLGISVAFGNP